LGLHDPALNGGKQRFAVCEREADILGSCRRLLERGDLLGCYGGTVVVGDLEQDADAHGIPLVRDGGTES
jgi:hypothetical protein